MPDKSYEAAAQDAASPAHEIWVSGSGERAQVYCICGRHFGEPLVYAQAILAHGITVGYELGASDASQLPAPARRSLHLDPD